MIGLIGSAIQAGVGFAQQAINKVNRPTYRIPNQVWEEIEMEKEDLNKDMPGFQKMRDDTGIQTAEQVKHLKEAGLPGSMGAGIASIYENKLGGLREIDVMNLQYMEAQEQQYKDSLRNLSDYKEKEWEYNEHMPYLNEEDARQDKFAAGSDNIAAAFGSAADLLSEYQTQSFLDKKEKEILDGEDNPNRIIPTNNGYTFNGTTYGDINDAITARRSYRKRQREGRRWQRKLNRN